MLRETDNCKEFHNGNLNIRFGEDDIKNARVDELLVLSSILSSVDCELIGDSYCLGNFEMGHTIYNAHSDLVYVFHWSALEVLKEGKTVKLYGRKPDLDERELIEKEC